MDVIIQALGLVLQPYVLGVMLLAALFGLFVGAMPGLTATMATALLVPFTFFMEPVPALAMIVAATAMAIFSGDIPGALLRMQPASVICFMTKQFLPKARVILYCDCAVAG